MLSRYLILNYKEHGYMGTWVMLQLIRVSTYEDKHSNYYTTLQHNDHDNDSF